MMLVVTSPWQWYIAFIMEESRVLSKRSKSQPDMEQVRAIKVGRDDQPVRERVNFSGK